MESKLTLSEIKKIINLDFPDFKIKSITRLKSGWDNFVFELNGEYIFRFPKSKGTALETEIKILKHLENKISLLIPVYEYIGRKFKYAAYKKIKGEPLTRNILKSLILSKQETLAKSIARFLAEFHKNLNLKIARELNLRHDSQSWRPLVIEKKLLPKLKDKELIAFLKKILVANSKAKPRKSDYVVAYNDLHGKNMAYGEKEGRLIGIFDFGDIAVDDVNREFACLLSLDEKITISIIKEYEKITQKKIDRWRVYYNAVIVDASILAVYVNRKQTKIYREALANLLRLKKLESRFC